jgi:hypothetical protein
MHTAGNTRPPSSIFATAVAIAGLLGVGAAVFFSVVVRAFGCEDGDCSPGTALLVVSCAGVVPVIAMLIESFRRTGHPWYWFVAGAIVYAFWGVLFMSVVVG